MPADAVCTLLAVVLMLAETTNEPDFELRSPASACATCKRYSASSMMTRVSPFLICWKSLNRISLIKKDAVTRQQYDNAYARYLGAKARYEQANSRRQSAVSVKNVQTEQLGGSRAGENVAEAQLNLARLNLSYTIIVATCDGVMGKKDIHVGQLVQPGQMLARIVDDNDVWVLANYRETQMDGITVGKTVNFTADAIPDVVFHGKVEALSAAAGNAYSMIPVDNATGNFVKVEQRVPVRIALTKDNDPKQVALLRAGLNVETKVRIKE